MRKGGIQLPEEKKNPHDKILSFVEWHFIYKKTDFRFNNSVSL